MPNNLFHLSPDELRDTNATLESQILSLTTTLDEIEPPELEESRLQYNGLIQLLSSLHKEIELLDSLTRVPEDEDELLRVENLPVLANAVEAKYHLLVKRIDVHIGELRRPDDAAFLKFVESGLMKVSKEMAAKEGTKYDTVGDLAVTSKTICLLAELEQIKNIVSKNVLPKAISEYLLTFKQGFTKELAASPQLAALFHNDCMLFVSKAKEFGCHDAHVAVWRNLGMQVLESQLTYQKQEITEAFDECDDVWMGASLDFDRLNLVVQRVSERLVALEELWTPVLKDTTTTLLARLYVVLVDWYWHHLTSLPDIGIHECDPLHVLSQSITSLALTLNIFDRVQSNYHKLTASTPLLKMSLMQVGNAYRRKKVVPPLSVEELEHFVNALFAESGAREAFLNELEEDGSP